MCSDEVCAHPEGMLDRDLRTTKYSLDKSTRTSTDNKCFRLRPGVLVKRTRSCACSLRNLCHHLRKSFHKLNQAVTVLLCLSYAVSIPTTSSLPIARTPREAMASTSERNPVRKQFLSIFNTAKSNAYQAQKYYNETFVEALNSPRVTQYKSERLEFFFKHTLEYFNFPNKSTFDATVLQEETTVKEFTKVFYDCFLRYNATMDMIGDETKVRNHLKIFLIEIKDYMIMENIEPLKEKYDQSDIKLEINDDTMGDRWLRDMIIYRDFAKTMDYVVQGYEHFWNLMNNEEASV